MDGVIEVVKIRFSRRLLESKAVAIGDMLKSVYDTNNDGIVDNADKVDNINIPNTIANVLTDHDKTTHDALNIDADTVDGYNIVGDVGWAFN